MGVLMGEVCEAAMEKGVSFPDLRIAHIPNDDARKLMPNVTYVISPFGLTETYGPVSVTSPKDPLEKRGTGGRMLDGNEVRVVDPQTGKDCPPGVPGEAWLRGLVTKGYWNRPEVNERAFDKDGWFHSEDLVTVDAEGYIQWVGRLKLMLKVGGENVSVEEVERVINGHDSVADCAVIGVKDKRKAEAVRAYVVVRPNHKLDEQELHAWLVPKLARFKMPREIMFRDSIPYLANGKHDRMALAEWAKEEFVL
jgi:fatty-acyl-CoA synthase